MEYYQGQLLEQEQGLMEYDEEDNKAAKLIKTAHNLNKKIDKPTKEDNEIMKTANEYKETFENNFLQKNGQYSVKFSTENVDEMVNMVTPTNMTVEVEKLGKIFTETQEVKIKEYDDTNNKLQGDKKLNIAERVKAVYQGESKESLDKLSKQWHPKNPLNFEQLKTNLKERFAPTKGKQTAIQLKERLENKSEHHKKVSQDLEKMEKEGTFSPTQTNILRVVLAEMTPDKVQGLRAKTNNYLSVRQGNLKGESGAKGKRTIGIKGKDLGISFSGKTETFLHEIGHHLAYKLTKEQWDKVVSVFNAEKGKGAKGHFRRTMDSRSAEYYMDNAKEFFAQSFAEWALTNKTQYEELIPLYKEILEKLQGYIEQINVNEKDLKDLNAIFDNAFEETEGKAKTKEKSTKRKAEQPKEKKTQAKQSKKTKPSQKTIQRRRQRAIAKDYDEIVKKKKRQKKVHKRKQI